MNNELDTLIPQYVTNKTELDGYKKICDRENAQIKKLMLTDNLSTYNVGQYKASCIVSTRESFNEEKLLEIAHHHGISEIVKTKEYIDYDALEDAIYKGRISSEIILEMDTAKEVKEVVSLRISKVKQEEE